MRDTEDGVAGIRGAGVAVVDINNRTGGLALPKRVAHAFRRAHGRASADGTFGHGIVQSSKDRIAGICCARVAVVDGERRCRNASGEFVTEAEAIAHIAIVVARGKTHRNVNDRTVGFANVRRARVAVHIDCFTGMAEPAATRIRACACTAIAAGGSIG
jgi:hypothetical protein